MPISATTKEKQDLYLPNPAQNPSPNSRLGDIGYVDHTGTWRRVVNALDATSCDQLGIKPLRLQGLASEYITDRLVHQREPIVNLYGADAGVEMFTDGEELANAVNPDGLDELRTATEQARHATRGVLIHPKEDSFVTALIVGPTTFERILDFGGTMWLTTWYNIYRSQIHKSTRKMLSLFPPSQNTTTMSLTFKEYFTQSWRTTYIQAGHPATPIAVGFKPGGSTDLSGTWSVIEIPNSTSRTTGGFASYPDGTEWVVGSQGDPCPFPSRVRFDFLKLLFCCCRTVDEERVEQLLQVPPPKPRNSKVEPSKES